MRFLENRFFFLQHVHPFAKKWLAASRNRQQFLRRNHTWLDSDATLPEELQNLVRARQTTNHQPECSRGRPQKAFTEASKKTKRRRVSDLLSLRTPVYIF